MGLSLTEFAAQHPGLHRRVAYDLENWMRDNYGPLTLDGWSTAYGYPPNAIRRFLAGDHTALDTPVSDAAERAQIDAIVGRVWGALDRVPGHVRRVIESERIPSDVKLDLLLGYVTDPGQVTVTADRQSKRRRA
jgi:hypothetical protein